MASLSVDLGYKHLFNDEEIKAIHKEKSNVILITQYTIYVFDEEKIKQIFG